MMRLVIDIYDGEDTQGTKEVVAMLLEPLGRVRVVQIIVDGNDEGYIHSPRHSGGQGPSPVYEGRPHLHPTENAGLRGQNNPMLAVPERERLCGRHPAESHRHGVLYGAKKHVKEKGHCDGRDAPHQAP